MIDDSLFQELNLNIQEAKEYGRISVEQLEKIVELLKPKSTEGPTLMEVFAKILIILEMTMKGVIKLEENNLKQLEMLTKLCQASGIKLEEK